MITAEQNEKLLKTITDSLIILIKLGFRVELREIIGQELESHQAHDAKDSLPTENPILVKDLNENFKPTILAVIKGKLNAAPVMQADGKAAGAAAKDVKANNADNKMQQAMTHFIRLRLLFMGMTTGAKEYECADLDAPVVFPDAKADGSKMPLALDTLQPVAQRKPQQLLAIIKNTVKSYVEKTAGLAPEVYVTTIGVQANLPRLGMLHLLDLGKGAVAAFIFSQDRFFYVNKIANICQLIELNDEKLAALKKYLPADNHFSALSKEQLQAIIALTSFEPAVTKDAGGLLQVLEDMLVSEAAQANAKVAAARAVAMAEERARWLHAKAEHEARATREHTSLVDRTQGLKAQNEGLVEQVRQSAAANVELAGINKELRQAVMGDDDMPEEFSGVAGLAAAAPGYGGLFNRHNFEVDRQPTIEPVLAPKPPNT